jgi:hypothetical protein
LISLSSGPRRLLVALGCQATVRLVSSGNCSTGLIRPLVAALAATWQRSRPKRRLSLLKTVKYRENYRFSRAMPIPPGMITILIRTRFPALVSFSQRVTGA